MHMVKQVNDALTQKAEYLSINNFMNFLQLILLNNKNVNIVCNIQNIVMVIKIKIKYLDFEFTCIKQTQLYFKLQ